MKVTDTTPPMDIKNLSTLNKKPVASEDANKAVTNKPLNEQLKPSNNQTDDVVSFSAASRQLYQATGQAVSNKNDAIGNGEEARNVLSQLITTMANQPDMAFKAYGSIAPEKVGASLA